MLKMAEKIQCKCKEPAPYNPLGICAPIMPFGNCVKCGGEIKEEAEKKTDWNEVDRLLKEMEVVLEKVQLLHQKVATKH